MHLNSICNLVSRHVSTHLCHLCYTFQYLYLHIFQAHILLTRQLPGDHSIPWPTYHMQRTNSKPFTGLIGLRHVITSQTVAYSAGWQDALLAFQNLAKPFKQSTIYLVFTFQRLSNSNQKSEDRVYGMGREL